MGICASLNELILFTYCDGLNPSNKLGERYMEVYRHIHKCKKCLNLRYIALEVEIPLALKDYMREFLVTGSNDPEEFYKLPEATPVIYKSMETNRVEPGQVWVTLIDEKEGKAIYPLLVTGSPKGDTIEVVPLSPDINRGGTILSIIDTPLGYPVVVNNKSVVEISTTDLGEFRGNAPNALAKLAKLANK